MRAEEMKLDHLPAELIHIVFRKLSIKDRVELSNVSRYCSDIFTLYAKELCDFQSLRPVIDFILMKTNNIPVFRNTNRIERLKTRILALTPDTPSAEWGKLYKEVIFAIRANNIVTNVQLTPLIYAIAYQNNHIVALKLIEIGVELNATDVNHHAALSFAARRSPVAIVHALIANGALINAVTSCNETALYISTYSYNRVEISLTLIKAGANVNIANHQGQTPLMRATIQNDESVVMALIRAGADLNVRDRYNNSALIFAKKNKYPGLVTILNQANAFESVKKVLKYSAPEFGNNSADSAHISNAARSLQSMGGSTLAC
jgi:hypothetical protein